jgi:hypothetical protein
MARGSAVRNCSDPVTVDTPRGPVEVMREQVRGLRRNSGWRWFWAARRVGRLDWQEASTPRRGDSQGDPVAGCVRPPPRPSNRCSPTAVPMSSS